MQRHRSGRSTAPAAHAGHGSHCLGVGAARALPLPGLVDEPHELVDVDLKVVGHEEGVAAAVEPAVDIEHATVHVDVYEVDVEDHDDHDHAHEGHVDGLESQER